MKATLLILLLFGLCSWSTHAQTGAACSLPGSARLQGIVGVTSAGRVELCLNGVWGTVCSMREHWGLKNAQVVCLSLGFSTAVTAVPQESLVAFLRADSSVPIHMTSVACDGTESSITECSHSTDVSQCSTSHFNDVAVVCTPGIVVAGDVRLLGDTEDHRGAVEYYDPILGWTGVCADSTYSSSWTSNRAAQIVCTQLGFQGGRAFTQSAPSLELGVAALDCSDSAFSLADCQRESLVISELCASQEAGWVECQQTGGGDFSVRLLPGGREGIVEVSINGRWGTVCDDTWTQPNAQVVCDQLGIESESAPSITPSMSYLMYMSRQKPFWLSSVVCSGASSLEDCSSNLLIGYSSSCSLATSISDSAEVNCGPPVPDRLSGGEIAGIVLGVLAFVGLVTLFFIYGPEKWKKRHSYSWYRKLTTPSRWCEYIGAWCRRHAPRRSVRRRNVTPMATTSTNQNRENPPAATVTTTSSERHESSSSSICEEEPEETPQTADTGGQGSDGTLTSSAPPPYQAAVSYPLATGPPAYSQAPPPIGFSADPTEEKVLPYPTAAGTDPAYPPPLQGAEQNLPYPS